MAWAGGHTANDGLASQILLQLAEPKHPSVDVYRTKLLRHGGVFCHYDSLYLV
jgi:hypothetical protein